MTLEKHELSFYFEDYLHLKEVVKLMTSKIFLLY